jgi:hypothetical protein
MIISIALVLFPYHYVLKGTNEEILVTLCMLTRSSASVLKVRVSNMCVSVNIFEGSPLLPLHALAFV